LAIKQQGETRRLDMSKLQAN